MDDHRLGCDVPPTNLMLKDSDERLEADLIDQ